MKIVHVITGLNDGGAEAVLYRLCKEEKKCIHIVVSLMDEGKYGPLLRAEGVEVVSINMKQGRISLLGVLLLWKVIRKFNPSVVQTWMYHADLIGGIVARLAGVKNVTWGIHHSNLSPGTIKNTTRIIAGVCSKLSYVVPNRIISCSRAAKKVHAEMGYKKNIISVIPNGYALSIYSIDDFSREQVRQHLNICEKTILLGMVARFDLQKDHLNFLEALSVLCKDMQFSDLRVALIGSGMNGSNSELVSMIEARKLSEMVLLLDQRNDIPDVMNALDIHVLSSLGEAFPNVLAEAMACGTPCVSTDVGDAALIVGETGWIVPAQNSIELAKALKDAISNVNDSDSWNLRRMAARERIVKEFGLDRMVQSYVDVWHKAVRRSFDD